MGSILSMFDNNTSDDNITLNDFAEAIKNGKIKNIITLAGAGISTSCGIPDFRSPKTGLYHNLQKYNLTNPQDIFSISYFLKNPQPFFTLSAELFPHKNKFKPSATHFFIKLLSDQGILLRHYTQNIDGLEVIAGVPETKVIEAHGNYRYGTCIKCQKQFKQDYYSKDIMNGLIPKCNNNNCRGIIKPNVVFFGEGLPSEFFNKISIDFKKCDMLIILGTSLKVYPFAGLITKVNDKCPRLLINMEHSAKGILNQNNRDYFYKGACDDGIHKLCQLIGWKNGLKKLIKIFNASIDNNDDQKSDNPDPKTDVSDPQTPTITDPQVGNDDISVSQSTVISVSVNSDQKSDNPNPKTYVSDPQVGVSQSPKISVSANLGQNDNKQELSPLGKTSLFMAAGRAIESEKDDALFNDPYAKIFAGKNGFMYLRDMSVKMNVNNINDNGYSNDLLKYIVSRTLWIDNKIKNAINNEFTTDVSQIVILGVGCDTRSYRLDCLQNANINIFELDLNDILKYRNNILINKCSAISKCNIHSLSVDFNDNNWINILLNNNNFNKNNDTLWICEGLFSYLKIDKIQNLLKLISESININNNIKNYIIGTILNENTKTQKELNKIWKNNNMNMMVFKGISRPHELLQKYNYNKYDIKPTGGKCKTYNEYLNELQKLLTKNNDDNNDDNVNKLVPDKLAKSFFFLGMK